MKQLSAVGTPQSAAQAADISPYRGDKDGRSQKFPQLGSPSKPSVSGFDGERRRKGVNGAFRPKGGNGVHGLFDDAGNVTK